MKHSKVSLLVAVGLAISLVVSGLSTGSTAARQNLCFGVEATIVGTNGDDELVGTSGVDVIDGGNGNDVISGLGGADLVCGGNGDDELNGGDGNDRLDGGSGNDTLLGEAGDDELLGENGNDVIDGGDGDDTIDGFNGSDELTGGSGDDELIGHNGDDSIDGGDGQDQIDGGNGSDLLSGGPGNDSIVGGNGNDTMFGEEGEDVLDAGNGGDFLNGGDDSDELLGGNGNDSCIFGELLTSCEVEDDELLEPEPLITLLDEDPAGEVIFEGGPGLAGVRIEIESAGGISANAIQVRPDRPASIGIAPVAVSAAFDITVPDNDDVISAQLTLPYDEARLDGFPEADLNIATYDETAQLWLPVSAAPVVDVEADTVTVTVDHFSLYAVVKSTERGIRSWDAGGIDSLFGITPVRCVSEDDGADVGVDVVFAVDTSGSMSSNDPNRLRVTASKAFLAELRPGDRAAVVDFDSTARTLIDLTDVTNEADRSLIRTRLDATGNASGGTNISRAVEEITSVLGANGGGGRLRIAILLTDGQSSYNTDLTDIAATQGIAIYTVGFGSGADFSLLRGIAEGTGAEAFTDLDVNEIVGIYEQLAGDIIDDGTDTDGDGLTDCEERNGLFIPARFFNPFLNENFDLDDFAELAFTDPETQFTDQDGSSDGVEVERVRFDDDPDIAEAFRVLVDRGRQTYFRAISGYPDRADSDNDGLIDPTFPAESETCASTSAFVSPFDWDSDNDNVSDGVECFNGTDPRVYDEGDYGVDQLEPFTLFVPDAYIDDTRDLPELIYEVDGNSVRSVAVQRFDYVFYNEDYDCVENCNALIQYAVDTTDSNGRTGICIRGRGDCRNDEGQIRDKIREIVAEQNVWDSDGFLRYEYIAASAALLCGRYFSGTGQCNLSSLEFDARLKADNLRPSEFDKGRTDTLRERLGNRLRQVDPERIQRIVDRIILSTRVYREVQTNSTDKRDRVEESVRRCTESNVLDQLGFVGGQHPCEILPIFLPGQVDAGGAALNDAQAIKDDPTKLILQYQPGAEAEARVKQQLQTLGLNTGTPREWYNQFDPCIGNVTGVTGLECDEYPLFATTRSGPPTTATSPVGARLLLVPASENRAEGTAYGAFTRACSAVRGSADRPPQPFIVIPLVEPFPGRTDWVCPT